MDHRDPNEPTCSYNELRRRQSVDAAAKAAVEAERAGRRVHSDYEPECDWDDKTEVGPLPPVAPRGATHTLSLPGGHVVGFVQPKPGPEGYRQIATAASKAAAAARDVNGPNPKDMAGRCKPDLSLVTGSMMTAIAAGLADGMKKYGRANWREIAVEALTYTSAAQRHIKAWEDGEELAPDSLVHHLGHAAASLCVLIDAMACSTWVDNRARAGRSAESFSKMTSHNLLQMLKAKPEPQQGPQLPPELSHPAARLATSAFAAELAANVFGNRCTSPASCQQAQRCLGGPKCERHEP